MCVTLQYSTSPNTIHVSFSIVHIFPLTMVFICVHVSGNKVIILRKFNSLKWDYKSAKAECDNLQQISIAFDKILILRQF